MTKGSGCVKEAFGIRIGMSYMLCLKNREDIDLTGYLHYGGSAGPKLCPTTYLLYTSTLDYLSLRRFSPQYFSTP